MTESESESLVQTIIKGLPGRTSELYTLESFKRAVDLYVGIDETTARENLKCFIREISSVAEEIGVLLAIHPDDPPVKLLGLPRLVSTREDAR